MQSRRSARHDNRGILVQAARLRGCSGLQSWRCTRGYRPSSHSRLNRNYSWNRFFSLFFGGGLGDFRLRGWFFGCLLFNGLRSLFDDLLVLDFLRSSMFGMFGMFGIFRKI
ncbi:hypothetical protein B0O80DRAFT_446481 [Mortierella sp. GBAus27b]|nr:hypothetical protein B0O80DRAFT_446481 [Mortierella sp. GBAus27b]